MAKIKRHKLNMTMRGILFDHALSKFIEPKLRDAEDAAFAAFEQSLHADWVREVKPHLGAIVKVITAPLAVNVYFNLPIVLKPTDIEKEFTLPNGSVVKRTDKIAGELSAPRCRYPAGATFADRLRDYITANGNELLRYGSFVNRRELSRPINLPSGNPALFCKYEPEKKAYVIQSPNSIPVCWTSTKTANAMLKYFQAADKRFQAEHSLRVAIAKIIQTSDTFEDLVAFWPEAKEVEARLCFPSDKPKNVLVALSDDDKGLICTHLHKRGIKPTACAA